MIDRYTPLGTPVVCRNGIFELDKAGLERILQYQIDAKVKGVVVNGTTGEFFNMRIGNVNPGIRTLNLMTVRDMIPRDIKVITNVTASDRAGSLDDVFNDTKDQVEIAYQLNSDALLLMPYYHDEINPDNVLEFCYEVADISKVPVILYDNPMMHSALGDNRFSADQLEELAGHRRIVGVKITGDSRSTVEGVLKQLPSDFKIYLGNEEMLWFALQQDRKPDGVVYSMGNIVPGLVQDVMADPSEAGKYRWKLARKGAYKENISRRDVEAGTTDGFSAEHITHSRVWKAYKDMLRVIAGLKAHLSQRGIIESGKLLNGAEVKLGLKKIRMLQLAEELSGK